MLPRLPPHRTRWYRFGGAIAAAAVLLATGCGDAAPDPAGQRGSGGEFFGANAPLLRAYATPELSDELDTIAASMADRGLGWARIIINQPVEQPAPGPVDWTIPDMVVASLAREGVRAHTAIVGTAAWSTTPDAAAACGQFAYPAKVGAWSAFVGETARRYGSQGTFWDENPGIKRLPVSVFEVGNEPDLRAFWCPDANPEQYAEVYGASREAALAADPKAEVVVGGLSPNFGPAPEGDVNVPDFYERMVAADPALTREMPAVAIHPYSDSPSNVLATIKAYRDALDDARLSRAGMLVNEVGWYTDGPENARQAPASERAGYIEQLAVVADETDCDLVGFGVHAWFSEEQDPANPDHWYGLADPTTGAPREGAIAYGEALAGKRSEEAEDLAAEALTLCTSG